MTAGNDGDPGSAPGPLIAPSILSADFANLGEEIRAIERAGADWVHVDVMDGHFVPNITIGPLVVEAVKRCTDLPLDVHLMIEQPDRYVADFVSAGATTVGVHVETCPHLHRSVENIRKAGARACVVLNPATPAMAVEAVLGDIDQILLMTVNPGFGGQSFIPGVLPKIRALSNWVQARGLDVDIEVDGGINPETIGEAAAVGANVFVAGNAVFGADDYKVAIDALRQGAQS